MIKVIQTLEDFKTFEPIWKELFDIAPSATPFQSFGYMVASLRFEPLQEANLYIIAIKDDQTNKWVGLFPLFLDAHGILKFINWAHTDFCEPILNPDFAHYSLYKEFAEFVNSNAAIKGLCLTNIRTSSPLLGVLKPFFPYTITHDINYFSEIDITPRPNDKDAIDAFRFIQAKQRKNLRKKKKETDQGCTFEIRSKAKGCRYPEQEVDLIVNRMLSTGVRVKEYFSAAMLAFWKELYDKEILSAALLFIDEEIESINFVYYDAKRREYIKWLMLYMESKWNMVINIKIAEYLYANEPGTTINFARGIYDYKLVNFHPDVKPLFRVMIAKTRWGHFKNIISTVFHYSKPIVKSWLGR